MVRKSQNYFLFNSICPVASQLICSLYIEVLFSYCIETITRGKTFQSVVYTSNMIFCNVQYFDIFSNMLNICSKKMSLHNKGNSEIGLLFLNNKINNICSILLCNIRNKDYVKIIFSITWIIQGVLATKILVVAIDVKRLHMLIVKVSLCEQISGLLNIRIFHKCWMVWKSQYYFLFDSICPVATVNCSLYTEVLFS